MDNPRLPVTQAPNGRPTPPIDTPGSVRRITPQPTVEEIAERVYQLFCQELRLNIERQGRNR